MSKAINRIRYMEGRLARARGEDRVLRDGRCSAKTRADWYAGWDEEDRIRLERERPEDAATPAEIGWLKEKLKTMLEDPGLCDEARQLMEAAMRPDGLRELLEEISEANAQTEGPAESAVPNPVKTHE